MKQRSLPEPGPTPTRPDLRHKLHRSEYAREMEMPSTATTCDAWPARSGSKTPLPPHTHRKSGGACYCQAQPSPPPVARPNRVGRTGQRDAPGTVHSPGGALSLGESPKLGVWETHALGGPGHSVLALASFQRAARRMAVHLRRRSCASWSGKCAQPERGRRLWRLLHFRARHWHEPSLSGGVGAVSGG